MQNDIIAKEADLAVKQDTKALEDLFSKSTDEIVDGLVNAADGDHELALRNLEQYMNTHDGFNRNIISAHQKLQNKVESMKNSRFGKMIDEALDNLDKKPRYAVTHSEWFGPWGDDKEIVDDFYTDDLDKAKEVARELSIKRNGLVHVDDEVEYKEVTRFIKGEETDFRNNPIKK